MGLFFKLDQAVPEISEFKALFRQDLKQGTYISEMALKNNICDVFFNFLEINIHNFVKNDPKFQNKGLFHAKFYGA